jgi:hypothetical protein
MESSNRKTVMIVEFDVFSGRLNPTWSLSEEQVMELLDAFQDLPPADRLPWENELGYRGFLLSNPDRIGGLAPHIRVYAGTVTMADDHVESYRDVHDIEHRLFLQASQHGYKAIVDSVLAGRK